MAKVKETNPVEQELTGVVSFGETVGSMPNPDVILRKSGISVDVYEEMLYDPQIFSAYQKRKRKIQQLKYSVEGEDTAIAEFVAGVLSDINMSRLISGMVRALPFGYSVSEIIWESVDGKWMPTDIKNRSNKRFEFSEQSELLYDTGVDGLKEAPYGKFIVHRNDYDDDGNPYGTSLNSRCYWYWRFKKHGWRVWGLYLEKYGDPALVLKSLETDEEKIKTLLAQLDSVSQGSNIVIGQSESLDPLNTPSSGSIGYSDYVSESDKQISKVYLGSSMLMDESKTGTYATAKEHGDDLMDIVMSDADAMANTIRYHLIEPIVVFNFGVDAEVPMILFYNDEEKDETQGIVETEGGTTPQQDEGTGEDETKASLQDGVSDSFFSTSQVEQFATDLPKHKQVIENISHNLGKSQVKLFKKHLSFNGMSNRPQYAQLELGKWYNELQDDLSVKISYAIFYIKLFAKVATPVYRVKFSGDMDELYEAFAIEGGTILPFDKARKIFEDKISISNEEFRRLVSEAKQDAFSIAGIKSASILKEIQKSLANAINDGTGEYEWKKIGEQLMKSLGVSPINKAHLANIYRTNLFSAYSRAGYEEYKLVEKDFPALMYDAVGDNRTRPAHLALDNKVFMADDPFWETHYPPNGFNSLVPTQRVSGNAYLGLKVGYQGEICKIRGESGGEFTVTAKHPVLTDRGWVDAKEVKVGDYLVAYNGSVDEGIGNRDIDVDNPPPTIEDVFNTLSLGISTIMPRSSVNLNGDSEFFTSDVEIVGMDRVLMDEIKASVGEFGKKLGFMLSYLRTTDRPCDSSLLSRSDLIGLFSRSDTGIKSESLDSILSVLSFDSGDSVNLDTLTFEVFGDLFPTFAKLRSYVSKGHSIDVQVDNLWWNWLVNFALSGADLTEFRSFAFGSFNSSITDVFVGGFGVNPEAFSTIIDTVTTDVVFDKVVDNVVTDFSGQVYDLQTKSGNIIAYGGLNKPHYVLSNCRCSVIPISKKKLAKVKVENGEDYKGSKYAPDKGWDFHGGKGKRLTNKPEPFGDPLDMNAPYSDYNLPKSIPFADFSERISPVVNFDDWYPYTDDIDIDGILGDSVHIEKGDWHIHPDVFEYIVQHPAEVWQQLGDNDAGKLYALGIKVDSYRNKPIPVGIKVDKYGNVTDIVNITNKDRNGVLLYPTYVPKERPFADMKYEYADSIDRWSSSLSGTDNIRKSFYNPEYSLNDTDASVKMDFDKMFTQTYGDNAGRTLYRGVKAKAHPKEFYTDAIEQSGGFQDNAPSSWTTSKKVAENFAGDGGIVFVADGVDIEGYDISDVSKFGNEREVVLAPATDLKLKKMHTDEYTETTYIELEVNK